MLAQRELRIALLLVKAIIVALQERRALLFRMQDWDLLDVVLWEALVGERSQLAMLRIRLVQILWVEDAVFRITPVLELAVSSLNLLYWYTSNFYRCDKSFYGCYDSHYSDGDHFCFLFHSNEYRYRHHYYDSFFFDCFDLHIKLPELSR